MCIYFRTIGIFDDEAFGADAGAKESGSKGKNTMGPVRPILAVWQVPASKLYRGSKRSAMEAFGSQEVLWKWLQEAETGQMYRSELCSKEPAIRGEGIPRLAESYQSVCEEILSDQSPLKHILKEAIMESIKR